MDIRNEIIKELVDIPVVGKTKKGGKALGYYLKAEDILTIVDYIILKKINEKNFIFVGKEIQIEMANEFRKNNSGKFNFQLEKFLPILYKRITIA